MSVGSGQALTRKLQINFYINFLRANLFCFRHVIRKWFVGWLRTVLLRIYLFDKNDSKYFNERTTKTYSDTSLQFHQPFAHIIFLFSERSKMLHSNRRKQFQNKCTANFCFWYLDKLPKIERTKITATAVVQCTPKFNHSFFDSQEQAAVGYRTSMQQQFHCIAVNARIHLMTWYFTADCCLLPLFCSCFNEWTTDIFVNVCHSYMLFKF